MDSISSKTYRICMKTELDFLHVKTAQGLVSEEDKGLAGVSAFLCSRDLYG